MNKNLEARRLSEYLTVQQAADLLGVAPSTLRNWDRTGKLEAIRHPLNGYRLYLQKDLELMLKRISQGTK